MLQILSAASCFFISTKLLKLKTSRIVSVSADETNKDRLVLDKFARGKFQKWQEISKEINTVKGANPEPYTIALFIEQLNAKAMQADGKIRLWYNVLRACTINQLFT